MSVGEEVTLCGRLPEAATGHRKRTIANGISGIPRATNQRMNFSCNLRGSTTCLLRSRTIEGGLQSQYEAEDRRAIGLRLSSTPGTKFSFDYFFTVICAISAINYATQHYWRGTGL